MDRINHTGRTPHNRQASPKAWQTIQTFRWRQPLILFLLAIGTLGLLYALTLLPGALLALGISALAWLLIYHWIFSSLRRIDQRIRAIIGNPSNWPVHTKSYALYKFADIHHAAQVVAETSGRCVQITSAHNIPLEIILSGLRDSIGHISPPMLVPRRVGYEQDEFFPSDSFWVVPASRAGSTPFIIRVRLPFRNNLAMLEVAAPRMDEAMRVLDEIGTWASANSVYRGKAIRVAFSSEVRGDYNEDESVDGMDLHFHKPQRIADADIVLDDAQRDVVERTIIDFHQRRAELTSLGLPSKRGVLFYGPPGTGKTYTCKYIAGQLEGVTTVVVTGHALLNMKAVCAVARSLQPALVLLEDVDLVFSNREINNHNTVLGEFIDQLDGFGETDEIIFILTTNAIERIEAAIKDRPGRVSQCIFFGPPSAALRRRYLSALFRPYNTSELDLERVIGQTEHVSQAFLKELVFRSVQVASLHLEPAAASLAIGDADVATALRDMTQGSGRAAQRIIGFRVDSAN